MADGVAAPGAWRRWRSSADQALDLLGRGAGFSLGLWSHLRQPIDRESARAVLQQRLREREPDFLLLARRAIYGHRASPYRRLLELVGCEYGDLERLVRDEGLEGALLTLYRQGVYLTVEELKGTRPVTRHGVTFPVGLRRLRNPCRWVQSALPGRAGWGGRVPLHRAMFDDLALNAGLTLQARDGRGWQHAIWFFLNDAALLWLVRLTGPGYRPVRWFSRINPRAPTATLLERLTPRLADWLSARASLQFPLPEYASIGDASPVLDWLEQELRAGQTPHLSTNNSLGVQVCQLALERGIDLSGARLTLGGEPLTERRLETMRRSGASAYPIYGSKESGLIGTGCLNPASPDDLHLYDDQHALIQPGAQTGPSDLPPEALLITSLRLSWPRVLLNVSLGDRARLGQRDCGCPLQRLGWSRHLDTVRSFEKMKVGTVLVLGGWLTRLLEEVLPARFGGGPTDYQLVEELDDVSAGTPRLRLLIHPAAAPDEAELVTLFVAALRNEGVLVDQLQQRPGWLQIERRPPLASAGGKILPIHRV